MRRLPFDGRLHKLQSRKAAVRPRAQRLRRVHERSGLPAGKTLLRSVWELFRGINSFRSPLIRDRVEDHGRVPQTHGVPVDDERGSWPQNASVASSELRSSANSGSPAIRS